MIMADYQTDLAYILIFLITTIIILTLHKSSNVNSHLPPTPFRLPVIGHLHLITPSAHRAFHKLSATYGPVFRLFLGSTSCIVVTSPEIAKEIFQLHDNAFLSRPHNTAAESITYGGKGLIFAPNGPYWNFIRHVTKKQLLNGKTLDFFLPTRRDEIDRFLRDLSEKAAVGMHVELDVELGKITSNVISRMVTGKRCSEEDDIRKILAEVDEIYIKFNLSDHIWFCKNLDLQGIRKRSRDIHIRFDKLVERILKEHEEERKGKKEKEEVKDFLDILVDISEVGSMKMTRENIKAFILDIYLGATDTAARTTEWALAELINHPTIMQKAIEEIDQFVGKTRLLQESDIPNLPYLRNIVKETLRLHPTGPLIQRQATEDCIVGGFHIPAKTSIFINLWSLGINPSYWENPLEFKPERFEDKPTDVRGQHFQLMPFGSGKRICPGISLGLQMVHLTLGSMIQCFAWKAGKYGDLASVDMEEGVGISIPRANPLVCVPVARLHPIPLPV